MPRRLSLDENDLRNILNGMVDGVITINNRGEILSFNKSAETIFGYKNEEAIGQNVNMLMPEPDHHQHDEYIKRYVATDEAHIIGMGRKVTALRKNGEHFPMLLSVIEYPVKIEGERWFIGSCLDITLEQQQEEQLRRSLKMEALGKLTGGISHDYNNMLGVILGYSELLAEHLKDMPMSLTYLKEIRHAAQRGSELTQDLLSFSRNRPVKQKIVNINDVLKNDYNMLAKILTTYIKLTLELEDDLWPVLVDDGCLEDAVFNLSINAMHAMPEGGTLKICTMNVQVSTLDSQVLNINKGDYVKMSVTDTGTGMTEKVKSNIFEPFFTTKEEKGTGLGLSQVYNFCYQAGGTIRVYSEPGQGSCFSLYIPRQNIQLVDDDIDYQSESTDDDQYYGSGKILIVDDETTFRELAEKILSSKGYKVICAEDGKQALSILEKEPIDLILSDVIMPELDGYELAHLIRHIYPDIKVQLCSGLTDSRGKTVTDETLHKNILHKPFSSKELLHRVKELLNS